MKLHQCNVSVVRILKQFFKMKNIAIPARGGSNNSEKNIQLFGVALLVHSIQYALNTDY
jgi:hypothetical protein